MLIRRNHPMLRGCRLFLVPEGKGFRNLVGLNATLTATGATITTSHLGPLPAVKLVAADGDYFTLAAFNKYGSDLHGLTVIARARPASAPAPSSAAALLCARVGAPPTPTAGFVLFMGNTPAATETGWVFSVHGNDGSTNFIRCPDPGLASSYVGKDCTVAGVYSPSLKKLALYVARPNAPQVVASVSDSIVRDPWGTSGPLKVGAFQDNSLPWDGEIGFVAVFDRAMADAEVRLWMDPKNWKFLVDTEPITFDPLVASYRTSVGVASIDGVSGPVTYTTTVDASAAFTGDLSSSSSPAGSVTYTTTVGVRSLGNADVPVFARYATRVAVTQLYSPTAPVSYTTTVLVSPSRVYRIDGRTDLLEVSRYRR